MAAMLSLPDGNTVVGVAGCYSGDLDTGEKLLRPLRSFGSPAADHFQPMPYIELQKSLDWWAAPGHQHYWKSSFMREVDDRALDVIVDFATRKPTPVCGVGLEFMHGAMQRVAPDATAFAHRSARYNFLMLGQWDFPRAKRNLPALGAGILGRHAAVSGRGRLCQLLE
jgi:hypothetical protein